MWDDKSPQDHTSKEECHLVTVGGHEYWIHRYEGVLNGIVSTGVENTITNVGRLARRGMRETDKEIIQIMLG